jgi:UDP-N-acetylmuramate--alanine ligase
MMDAKYVHIVGIGGIGTSAVAKWWLDRGAHVSGSDLTQSPITEEVMATGANVKIGHFTENLPREADLLVYSSAIPVTNPERQAAKELGITELSYPEFLGKLAEEKKTIAITGTNGKSTTTAMVAKILIDAGYDPTVILGTKSPDLDGTNLRIGKSDWLVVEACEHMANMLQIIPNIGVITNIEEDHLDFYRDLNHIKQSFKKWVDQMGVCGKVILNGNEKNSMSLNAENPAVFKIGERSIKGGSQTFEVAGVDVTLTIPGAFNAENAAAALTAAHIAGVEDDSALASLKAFKGTWRRFEHVGAWKEAEVYSDYAHHPSAVQGSIAAFKEFFPNRQLIIVFQPHQHSRTHELFDEFVESFDQADHLIVTEIYEVAGRTEEKFESSEDMVAAIKARDTIKSVDYAKDLESAQTQLETLTRPSDIIVAMGAGTVDELARRIAGETRVSRGDQVV